MDSSVSQFTNFYKWAETIADPRTKDWFLLHSPHATIAIVAGYLCFVLHLGPRLMKNIAPINLGLLLPSYNFFLVALNYHIAKEAIIGAIGAGYNLQCNIANTNSSNTYEMRIANALWWYYFSKIIELLDTVCFILRKRDRQVTLLHVYHHSTMPLLWWIGAKWVPGGQSVISATCNSIIHILMYSYYGLAAFGPKMQKYLWWKKYLTMLQLLQFLVVFVHTASSIYTGCKFPLWMQWALLLYLISMISLFGNFYLHEYVRKSNSKKLN